MTDYFAILDQPRRPWLEADAVKEAFHRASAIFHPDVPVTGDAARFSELNAAYTMLREPAGRLRHLLELTAPELLSATAAPPMELGDLFMKIAGLRQRLESFLRKRQAATSPLAQALLAGDEKDLRRELNAVQETLEAAEAIALEEVRAVDRNCDETSVSSLAVLSPIYRRLSYLSRWLMQTRESLFTLAC